MVWLWTSPKEAFKTTHSPHVASSQQTDTSRTPLGPLSIHRVFETHETQSESKQSVWLLDKAKYTPVVCFEIVSHCVLDLHPLLLLFFQPCTLSPLTVYPKDAKDESRAIRFKVAKKKDNIWMMRHLSPDSSLMWCHLPSPTSTVHSSILGTKCPLPFYSSIKALLFVYQIYILFWIGL